MVQTPTFNPRSIPIFGEQISKIGQVYDVLSSPCDIDTSIWIKAAFHATPYLLLSLTTPECLDIDLDRGGRRHKRLRRFRFRWTQILQPTLVIRGAPTVVRFLFNAYERTAWYLLVVDASLDFLVNWTSMAYQWSECDTPNNPYGICANGLAYIPANQEVQLTFDTLNSNDNGIHVNLHGIRVDPGINASIAVCGQAIPSPWGEPISVEWKIRNFLTGVEVMGGRRDRGPNGKVEFGDFFRDWPFNAPGAEYRLYVRVTSPGTTVALTGVQFEAFGRATKGLIPAMPDCNPFDDD